MSKIMEVNGAIPPKVAAVHDLSCVGRCALTVVIPILSAQGIQVCPLPTAVLSTHTGGYDNFTFLDLTDEMPKIVKHWESIGERFDAVYSGFLGSAGQIRLVLDFVSYVRRTNPNALFLATLLWVMTAKSTQLIPTKCAALPQGSPTKRIS